jgi:hypothetical protein
LQRASLSTGTGLNLVDPVVPQKKVQVGTQRNGEKIVLPKHQDMTILQTSYDIVLNPVTAVGTNLITSGGEIDLNMPEGGGGATGTCDNLLIEFDLTNTSGSSCTLIPAAQILRDFRILTASGGLLVQCISGDHLFYDLAYLTNNNLTAMASFLNTSTTLGEGASISAGATVTYKIPVLSSFLTCSNIFLPGIRGGLRFRLTFRPSTDTVISGTAPLIGNVRMHLHGQAQPQDFVSKIIKQYWTNVQEFRFPVSQNFEVSQALTASSSNSFQLSSLTGLIAGGFLILRTSTTGTGNYTLTSINNGTFDIVDGSDRSLLGVPTKGTHNIAFDWQRQFNNTVTTTTPIYVVAHAQSLQMLLQDGNNTGFGVYDGNNRLKLQFDSTLGSATYQINFLAKQYAILRLENGAILQPPILS